MEFRITWIAIVTTLVPQKDAADDGGWTACRNNRTLLKSTTSTSGHRRSFVTTPEVMRLPFAFKRVHRGL